MKITNSTHWDTAQVRRVFSLVLAGWNKRHASMPRRVVNSKRLRIKVTYSKGWSGFHGCAWLNTGHMDLRLPRPVGHGIKQKVLHHEHGQEIGADGKTWYFSRPIPGTEHVIERKAVKALDIGKLAFLFEHELAHCAGYRHPQMGHLNKWETAETGRYDYVKHLTVEVAVPKVAQKVDRATMTFERNKASLKRWETKAKRAATAIKKYKAAIKRYEAKAAKP